MGKWLGYTKMVWYRGSTKVVGVSIFGKMVGVIESGREVIRSVRGINILGKWYGVNGSGR